MNDSWFVVWFVTLQLPQLVACSRKPSEHAEHPTLSNVSQPVCWPSTFGPFAIGLHAAVDFGCALWANVQREVRVFCSNELMQDAVTLTPSA